MFNQISTVGLGFGALSGGNLLLHETFEMGKVVLCIFASGVM